MENLYYTIDLKKKKKIMKGSGLTVPIINLLPPEYNQSHGKQLNNLSDLIMNTPNNKCCNSTSQRLLSLIINILVWCEDKSGSH